VTGRHSLLVVEQREDRREAQCQRGDRDQRDQREPVVLLLGTASIRCAALSREEHGHREQVRQEERIAGEEYSHERFERRGAEPHEHAEQRR
jgi:hypothetical protein